jgi:phosphoglycolate phosphatase
MLFDNYIFDLDGTLTDSRLGIYNSMVYALEQMNSADIPEGFPVGFVGPPLQKGFEQVFGMNESEVKQAVRLFREYYNDRGWMENVPYDGIAELLAELSQTNANVFVATAKLEDYANRIIEHFEMDPYIKKLYGANYEEKKAGKTHIIERAVMENRLHNESTVVIGDTHYDINGAKELELKSIAVGYGFSEEEELLKISPDYYAAEVEDLYEIILG